MTIKNQITLNGDEIAVLEWREGSTLCCRDISLKELRNKWTEFGSYTTVKFEQRRGDSVWFNEHDQLCIGVQADHTWYSKLTFAKSIEMAFAADALFKQGATKSEVIDYLRQM